MNRSYVKLHLEALLDLDSQFTDIVQPQKGLKMADNHIRAILDWSLTYSKYASQILEQDEIRKKLDQLNDQFEEQKLKKDRVSNIR